MNPRLTPRMIRTVHAVLGVLHLAAAGLTAWRTARAAYDHEPYWVLALALATMLLAGNVLFHVVRAITPHHCIPDPAPIAETPVAEAPVAEEPDIRQPFIAESAHIVLDPHGLGGHGQPSYVLSVIGHRQNQRVGLESIVLPRCTAGPLVGSLLAHVHFEEGEPAVADLIAEMMAQYSDLHTRMVILHDAHPGHVCCQAGHLTSGREHTCTKAQP